MANPYTSLPPKSFWRTAVGDLNPFDIAQVYQKKFDISGADKIATAGSRFAQHIGKQLRESGFNYLDLEPAPDLLPASDRNAFGYGLYSARYGNVYTARQLIQLFDHASGKFSPTDSVWRKDNRFYDAFRPTIEPNGFGSEDELRTLRTRHLTAAQNVFSTASVFVFTFGLTEAWLSRADGAAYPTCPGVVAGEFSDDKYKFHNFSFDETIADMRGVIQRLVGFNQSIRILLTVSPVPLTATATGEHVLSATTYSKSVLRAVAGQLAAEFDCVAYFPSYELIACAPMRGMFYMPNMRSVSPSGVEYVMRHFIKHHPAPSVLVRNETAQPTASKGIDADDAVCEERLLELFQLIKAGGRT